MRSTANELASAIMALIWLSAGAIAQDCVSCHSGLTPGIVTDWQASIHAAAGVDCGGCHGEKHVSADDVRMAGLPTPQDCAVCHETQVQQFTSGKHAHAWTAMQAMPTIHWQPMVLIEGMKGCGGCHKIGVKSDAEMMKLRTEGSGFGLASCDACHTRHAFSVSEAGQPEACQTCHMGFDHPQWEVYSASKHGVRYTLIRQGVLAAGAVAPTCQQCHMQGGNHEVRTAWGFLAVRLPLSEDPRWKADQVTILQALGVLDLEGNPTPRLDAVKVADMARLNEPSFQIERDKMIATCHQCHSAEFARIEMDKGDKLIRHADSLLAEAIRVVAGLYQDGVLQKPASYAYPFPDLLTFHNAPTPIEQTLFVMHLEHRMRAFQGMFHMNPDYVLWYGWSEMVRDLAEIKYLAAQLRKER